MAIKNTNKTASKKKGNNPIINTINITSIKRSKQDIQNWRTALQNAESALNPRRVLLYDLYSDIILDAHLSSVMDKRYLAITNQNIVFTNENGEENEEISNLINTPEFTQTLRHFLDAIFWGHSLIEFEFTEGLKPYLVPRKHVEPHKGVILKNQYDNDGFSYREPPYTNHTIEIGHKDDLGLLLKAAPYVLYKRGGFGDWAQFCEVFGMPLRVGRYDGFDEETRAKLESALEDAGSAAYMVIPEESKIDFVESKATGSNTLYKGLIETCDKQISKLIVGQTMTTEDGSSLSQAKVHKEIEEAIHFADRLFIEKILNGKFKELLAGHGWNTSGNFGFAESETLSQKEQLEIALKVDKVAPIDRKWYYETFNLPEAKKIEPPVREQKSEGAREPEEKTPEGTFKRFLNSLGFFVCPPA